MHQEYLHDPHPLYHTGVACYSGKLSRYWNVIVSKSRFGVGLGVYGDGIDQIVPMSHSEGHCGMYPWSCGVSYMKNI